MTPLTPVWIYTILLCGHYSISSKLWFTFLEVLVTLIQVFFYTKCCFTSWFKDKIHSITIYHMVPFSLDCRPFFVDYLRKAMFVFLIWHKTRVCSKKDFSKLSCFSPKRFSLRLSKHGSCAVTEHSESSPCFLLCLQLQCKIYPDCTKWIIERSQVLDVGDPPQYHQGLLQKKKFSVKGKPWLVESRQTGRQEDTRIPSGGFKEQNNLHTKHVSFGLSPNIVVGVRARLARRRVSHLNGTWDVCWCFQFSRGHELKCPFCFKHFIVFVSIVYRDRRILTVSV